MFDSIREFVKALMDGRKFKYEGYEYFFDEEHGFLKFNKTRGRTSMTNIDFMVYVLSLTEVIGEQKWYNNIPERGVLCKVQTLPNVAYTIARINSYVEDAHFPFHSFDNDETYIAAIPLTKEEALEYVYEGVLK